MKLQALANELDGYHTKLQDAIKNGGDSESIYDSILSIQSIMNDMAQNQIFKSI